jgi:hypothetical protein
MRPPLHPEMGPIVLSARVARQLAGIVWRHSCDLRSSPATCAATAARNLPGDYDAMVRLALHSLAVYLNLGWSTDEWQVEVLRSAHYGHGFRRCFFFDYKAGRRPYPRVTNRGVQNSPKRRASNRRLGLGDD